MVGKLSIQSPYKILLKVSEKIHKKKDLNQRKQQSENLIKNSCQ